MKNPHAVEMGRLGGRVTSPAKAEAARRNGLKAHKPRKKALIALHGGLRAAARATGLDAGYLSYASRGIRQPGPKLLRVLGLAEKKIYADVK